MPAKLFHLLLDQGKPDPASSGTTSVTLKLSQDAKIVYQTIGKVGAWERLKQGILLLTASIVCASLTRLPHILSIAA
jgi:hypothetical protein